MVLLLDSASDPSLELPNSRTPSGLSTLLDSTMHRKYRREPEPEFGKETITVYACDCSTEALERTKEVIDAAMEQRAFLSDAFVCLLDVKNNGNIVTELTSSTEADCCTSGVDFVTLIFTLSAVPLDRMSKAIAECFSVLKPGGLLLFRDYGLYDMTMLRFEPSQKVGYREYMRSDGIHSYFFSLDSTRDLFIAAGFIEQELEYCCIKSVNRRNGKSMRRVWIHGKFRKPT
ncbi:hypothetical protein RJ639_010598 [Escallonia herrerae]|uniref:Methyltransferase-like protein n=1 Tax=Escallonia herrerae TaxID=1293975 RepID=A0AA88VPS9_9ASTE|nr:hypothetical protein RJ639_010598 [Escallonia herrerae]